MEKRPEKKAEWGYNPTTHSWKYVLPKPDWLRRLSIDTQVRISSKDTLKEIQEGKISNIEDIRIELNFADEYPFAVGLILHSDNKADLEKNISCIEEFKSRYKIPEESFKEFVKYVSLGSIGIFGGFMIPPDWCRSFDARDQMVLKGSCFKNGLYLAERYNVLDNKFMGMVKEEYNRELFRGDIKRFRENPTYHSIYSAECIAKYSLEDEKLTRKAAKDRFKTLLLEKKVEQLRSPRWERDINEDFRNLIKEEKKFSGILDVDYMKSEIEQWKADIESFQKAK
ncbi:MAG: hypothetical protein Q7S33_03955 [Nanoarchaeota archaeon]|nr:hypothetical protein [Nanoarchaeota archaeon]